MTLEFYRMSGNTSLMPVLAHWSANATQPDAAVTATTHLRGWAIYQILSKLKQTEIHIIIPTPAPTI